MGNRLTVRQKEIICHLTNGCELFHDPFFKNGKHYLMVKGREFVCRYKRVVILNLEIEGLVRDHRNKLGVRLTPKAIELFKPQTP